MGPNASMVVYLNAVTYFASQMIVCLFERPCFAKSVIHGCLGRGHESDWRNLALAVPQSQPASLRPDENPWPLRNMEYFTYRSLSNPECPNHPTCRVSIGSL